MIKPPFKIGDKAWTYQTVSKSDFNIIQVVVNDCYFRWSNKSWLYHVSARKGSSTDKPNLFAEPEECREFLAQKLAREFKAVPLEYESERVSK